MRNIVSPCKVLVMNWICPKCGARMRQSGDGWRCPSCGYYVPRGTLWFARLVSAIACAVGQHKWIAHFEVGPCWPWVGIRGFDECPRVCVCMRCGVLDVVAGGFPEAAPTPPLPERGPYRTAGG